MRGGPALTSWRSPVCGAEGRQRNDLTPTSSSRKDGRGGGWRTARFGLTVLVTLPRALEMRRLPTAGAGSNVDVAMGVRPGPPTGRTSEGRSRVPQSPDLERILAQIQSVPGWLQPLDCSLFIAMDGAVRQRGATGDALEIGVFRGKSAVLIGALLAPGERLILCDLFVDGLEPFFAHWDRFHDWRPVVHAGPSSTLSGAGLSPIIRFAHVDGGHAFDDVVADADLLLPLMAPGGLIVFDDIASRRHPGVAAAVWPIVRDGRLAPFCITREKLYCTLEADLAADLAGEVSAWATRSHTPAFAHSIHGLSVIRLEPARPPRWAPRRLAAAMVPPGFVWIADQIRRRRRDRHEARLRHPAGA